VVKPEKLQWNENACADFYVGRTHFVLNVPGSHNLYNALAAIAVGEAFRIPKAQMAKALQNFHATNMRMEIKKCNGFKIVSDCYNANPSSTRMALQTIGNMNVDGCRIAVLGDMLELVKESGELHKAIGGLVPEMNFDLLVAVGKDARRYVEGAKAKGMANVEHFSSVQEAIEFLAAVVSKGDVLLVKGSRGMKMETVVDALLKLSPVSKI
jgi:UDP-N-acetylmuramoyl-tripeptide--D-alanyl-D-alanine ligase